MLITAVGGGWAECTRDRPRGQTQGKRQTWGDTDTDTEVGTKIGRGHIPRARQCRNGGKTCEEKDTSMELNGGKKGPGNKRQKNRKSPLETAPPPPEWSRLCHLWQHSHPPRLLVPRLSVTIRELWKALRASPTRWMKSSTTRSKCTEPGDTWGQRVCEEVEFKVRRGQERQSWRLGLTC